MGGRKRLHVTALRLIFALGACLFGSNLLFSFTFKKGECEGRHNKLAFSVPSEFTYNKVVVIVAFERFQYFKQCVDALSSAKGSEEYVVLVYVDGAPGDPYNFDIIGRQNILLYSYQLQQLALRGVGFKEVVVSEADTNLGIWANKKRALEGSFELSDFVILLEEDIVLARDGLHWFEWHVESGYIFKRPELAVATCFAVTFPYSRLAKVDAYDILGVSMLGLLEKFYRHHYHHPWGWATWRQTWDAVKDDWTGQDQHLLQLIRNHSWFESQPMVARCNNVGARGANKKGIIVGPVHQRQVTSDRFTITRPCEFKEIQRFNLSDRIDADIPDIFDLVRHGHLETEEKLSLSEYASRVTSWKFKQSDPSFWKSSC